MPTKAPGRACTAPAKPPVVQHCVATESVPLRSKLGGRRRRRGLPRLHDEHRVVAVRQRDLKRLQLLEPALPPPPATSAVASGTSEKGLGGPVYLKYAAQTRQRWYSLLSVQSLMAFVQNIRLENDMTASPPGFMTRSLPVLV